MDIDVNGTAPEDFVPQMKRLRIKKMEKTVPGYKKAVSRVVRFQFSPCH